MRRRSVTKALLAGVATTLLYALLPAVASAQDGGVPWVTVDPVIAGTPREGQTLTTTAEWIGDPMPTAAWRWQRCSAAASCSSIAGATSDRYIAAAADVGSALRVRLTVTNTKGEDVHYSELTAVVQAAPPPPPPSPTPTPTPSTSTSTPTPNPTSTPSVMPAPVPPAVTPASVLPPLLDPFPVVRIRGLLTPTGARITLFTVRVPSDVKVAVRCRGASCPSQRFAGRSSSESLIRLRRFERRLRAGTRLSIKVTQPGRIGKWTTILIRRGAAPKRSDRCAYPQVRLPAPCPSG